MSDKSNVRCLFLDIGGVLLTNGWDHHMRRAAAEKFGLDYDEMSERHHLTFDTYEEGKLTLDQYLQRVVFFKERPFTAREFREHMFKQSKPLPDMIDWVGRLRAKHALKVVAISNEGRELTIHRNRKFNLGRIIDFFISSSFVHLRKPDEDLYRMALDTTQVEPDEAFYIDDRGMFVEVARGIGIRGLHHTHYEITRDKLASLGLDSG